MTIEDDKHQNQLNVIVIISGILHHTQCLICCELHLFYCKRSSDSDPSFVDRGVVPYFLLVDEDEHVHNVIKICSFTSNRMYMLSRVVHL